MLLKKSKFILNPISFLNEEKDSKPSYKGFAKVSKFGRSALNGHNNTGKITVFNRGAGAKRKYRVIDFLRYIWNMKGQILTVEHDPNRTTLVNLVIYTHGVMSYILSTNTISNYPAIGVGDYTVGTEFRLGYCSYLKKIKPGCFINSLETRLLRGAQYVRAGGTYAKLVSLTTTYAIVKLRSQSLLKVNNNCIATVGVLSKNRNIKTRSTLKASFNRYMGFRPTVRGVAKNPIDHPHGGGQGKTSGGRPSVSPWAQITKGKRTRRKINYVKTILKR